MIVKNPFLEVSAVGPKQYPKNDLPEIVLAGKSNVGKSSFINTMIGRKSLARTSGEPGKTRQINFYNIDATFYLVDLPGYGYSKMSHTEQEKVGKFIEEYLATSKKIALLVLLVDIRHKPSQNDWMMLQYLRSLEVPHLILANKADKVAPTKVESYLTELKKDLQMKGNEILLPFSSEKKIYTDAVWEVMEKYIADKQ